MTCMGTVNNYAGLLSTRLFLGVAEAGLFPGVAYFLSGVYKLKLRSFTPKADGLQNGTSARRCNSDKLSFSQLPV